MPPIGCWEWTGQREYYGHGRLTVGKYVWKAHRLSWAIVGGPIPRGMKVLHVCDNPPCVRNDEPGIYFVNGISRPRFGHLFLGTQADNVADMIAKGRAVKATPMLGENNPAAKVSAETVLLIRKLYAAGGILQRTLAVDFGLSRTQIQRIIRGHRRAGDGGPIAPHPVRKVTPAVVTEILKRRAAGEKYARIGRAVGLHGSTVKDVLEGRIKPAHG